MIIQQLPRRSLKLITFLGLLFLVLVAFCFPFSAIVFAHHTHPYSNTYTIQDGDDDGGDHGGDDGGDDGGDHGGDDGGDDGTNTGDHSEKDEDHDGISDEDERVNEREVDVEVEESHASISSKSRNEEVRNEYSVEIDTEEGISFDVQFSSSDINGSYDLEYSLQISAFLEYVDVSGEGAYNDTVDELIKIVPLESFKAITYQLLNISNNLIYELTIQSTDDIFLVKVYISNEFSLIHNSTLISPNELKIDFQISNFPFEENNSQLALLLSLSGEGEYEYDTETEDEMSGRATHDESEIEINAGDYAGFFAWAETAIIDGISKSVKVSYQLDEEDTLLIFSYPRGSIIFHDPKIGIANILIESGTSPIDWNWVSRTNIIFDSLTTTDYLLTVGISLGIIGILSAISIIIKRREIKLEKY